MTSFLYTLEIPQTDVDEVRTIREFLDVFKETEGLPPRRVVEFSYNNCFQASIDMGPFEALYGCPC